jgi:dipeptidase D
MRRCEAVGNCYKITLSGFLGGHSGVDIHRGHENAIKVLAECLDNLGEIRLITFEGGSADNAIPSRAEATFLADKSAEELGKRIASVFQKYKASEPNGKITLEATAKEGLSLDTDSTNKLLSLICYEPTGIVAMSEDIEGLVETSLNIGTAHLGEEYFELVISIRSPLEESKFAVLSEVDRIAWTHRATLTASGDYPGWAYRKQSPLRDACCESHRELFGSSPKVITIHAGLECGLFSSKLSGLDCISMGPDTHEVHTANEWFSLASAERFWRLLIKVLDKI